MKTAARNRGQIEPRGDNKWLLRVYIGRDAAGKRQYTSKVFQGTAKQAEKELTQMHGAVDTKTYVAPSRMSLCEYLTGAKLASEVTTDDPETWGGWMRAQRKLGPKTKRSYAERIRKDILPQLGHHRLETLTDETINAWMEWMEETRELGPRTIQFSLVVLKASLEDAVRKGKLVRNPAAYVDAPKIVKTAPKVLSMEQTAAFLTHSRESRRHVLWATLLMTGLRPSEALALKWDDLHIQTTLDVQGKPEEAGVLQITKALVEVKAGKYEIGPTKTNRMGAVGIPANLVALLKSHRVRQATEIIRIGESYIRQGFIFAGRTGNPLDISAVRLRWKQDLKSAGLPEVRLHGARHSHATALLEANVHPKVVADRLRHSSTKITLDIYSHVLTSMQNAATAVVGNMLTEAAVCRTSPMQGTGS